MLFERLDIVPIINEYRVAKIRKKVGEIEEMESRPLPDNKFAVAVVNFGRMGRMEPTPKMQGWNVSSQQYHGWVTLIEYVAQVAVVLGFLLTHAFIEVSSEISFNSILYRILFPTEYSLLFVGIYFGVSFLNFLISQVFIRTRLNCNEI